MVTTQPAQDQAGEALVPTVTSVTSKSQDLIEQVTYTHIHKGGEQHQKSAGDPGDTGDKPRPERVCAISSTGDSPGDTPGDALAPPPADPQQAGPDPLAPILERLAKPGRVRLALTKLPGNPEMLLLRDARVPYPSSLMHLPRYTRAEWGLLGLQTPEEAIRLHGLKVMFPGSSLVPGDGVEGVAVYRPPAVPGKPSLLSAPETDDTQGDLFS